MKRFGLIAERVAFANQVDYTSCPDVQNFIQEKANYEAFLEWCRKPERRALRDDLFFPEKKESIVKRLISWITP